MFLMLGLILGFVLGFTIGKLNSKTKHIQIQHNADNSEAVQIMNINNTHKVKK